MDTKGKVENMWKYVWKDILEQACFLPVTAFLEIVHGNVSDDARADHSS